MSKLVAFWSDVDELFSQIKTVGVVPFPGKKFVSPYQRVRQREREREWN